MRFKFPSEFKIITKFLCILCLVIGVSCEVDDVLNTNSTVVAAEQESTNDTSTDMGDSQIVEEPSFASATTVFTAMGTGFNLGNTFDFDIQQTDSSTIFPIIDLYYDAGLRHIRIPVTWLSSFDGDTLADENGNVNFNHPRFLQLKAVIDYAITKEMYVVLNAHHESILFSNYDNTAFYNNMFSTLWTDIATYFKDYPEQLIFEILNEPHGVFGDWSGGINPNSTAALELTRKINDVGYTAIRDTQGNNSSRTLMISTNGLGSINLIDDMYPSKTNLPGGGTDNHLAMQVHTYDPWSFCGPTGSNANWPGDQNIINRIALATTQAAALEIPINIGEFGVGRQSNSEERNDDIVRQYYRTMRIECLNASIAPTLWDDRGWFALISKNDSGNYEFKNCIVPNTMEP